MEANEMQNFSDLFDEVLYMFRTDPLSIIRNNLNAVYKQEVFVMLVLVFVC